MGLALGSGGARGFAHLGVLRALREAGVAPYCFAGTSMGAVVGAFAAAGKAEELETYVLSLDWPRIVRYGDVAWSLRQGGLLKGNVFHQQLAQRLGAATFADLRMPFAAVATDVESGQRVVMRSGDLALAVRASASIPGLFAPVRFAGTWLIDGAFTDPVPVGEARALGAEKVVAIDVSPEVSRAAPRGGRPGVKDILLQAMSIAEAGLAGGGACAPQGVELVGLLHHLDAEGHVAVRAAVAAAGGAPLYEELVGTGTQGDGECYDK
mgnify:CR=1 FL=1